MYSGKSYKLTTEEYNYLLPVLRNKLLYSNEKHYFTGNIEDLQDMLDRLKGLYDYYKDLNSMTAYKCSMNGTLEPFRNELNFFY
jgi:hypothetical protein